VSRQTLVARHRDHLISIQDQLAVGHVQLKFGLHFLKALLLVSNVHDSDCIGFMQARVGSRQSSYLVKFCQLIEAHVDQILTRALVVVILSMCNCVELLTTAIKEQRIYVIATFELLQVFLEVSSQLLVALITTSAESEFDDIAQILPLRTCLG